MEQDQIKTEIHQINERLDTMDSRLGTMESRLDTMDSRLNTMELRLDNMDSRLTKVEHAIISLTSDIRALSDKQSWLLATCLTSMGIFAAASVAVVLKI